MQRAIEPKERTFGIPERPSFVQSGIIVRTPQGGTHNDYGVVQWGNLYIFVRGKLIKKHRTEFVLNAIATCSIFWCDTHQKYQAVEIRSIVAPVSTAPLKARHA